MPCWVWTGPTAVGSELEGGCVLCVVCCVIVVLRLAADPRHAIHDREQPGRHSNRHSNRSSGWYTRILVQLYVRQCGHRHASKDGGRWCSTWHSMRHSNAAQQIAMNKLLYCVIIGIPTIEYRIGSRGLQYIYSRARPESMEGREFRVLGSKMPTRQTTRPQITKR